MSPNLSPASEHLQNLSTANALALMIYAVTTKGRCLSEEELQAAAFFLKSDGQPFDFSGYSFRMRPPIFSWELHVDLKRLRNVLHFVEPCETGDGNGHTPLRLTAAGAAWVSQIEAPPDVVDAVSSGVLRILEKPGDDRLRDFWRYQELGR